MQRHKHKQTLTDNVKWNVSFVFNQNSSNSSSNRQSCIAIVQAAVSAKSVPWWTMCEMTAGRKKEDSPLNFLLFSPLPVGKILQCKRLHSQMHSHTLKSVCIWRGRWFVLVCHHTKLLYCTVTPSTFKRGQRRWDKQRKKAINNFLPLLMALPRKGTTAAAPVD